MNALTGGGPAPLHPYQEEGVAFLYDRTRAILADEPGLGKSAVALKAAAKRGFQRVLCLGPACAGVSWPGQVRLWGGVHFNKGLGNYHDINHIRQFGLGKPGFYFVSYDMLSFDERGELLRMLTSCAAWDLLLLDEVQMLKTEGTKRTSAVYDYPTGLIYAAHNIWLLTGTLTPNHSGEMYTHMAGLFPKQLRKAMGGRRPNLPTRQDFEDKFCRVEDTRFGRVIQGSQNQGELRKAMQDVVLRRRKADVLDDLPPLDFFTAPIRLDAKTVNGFYQQAMIEQGLPPDTFPVHDEKELLELLKRSETQYSRAMQALGRAKVAGCVEWIEDRLASGEPKILVFARHTSVLAGLNILLQDHDPVVFQGATSQGERVRAVSRFQDPKDPCRVFIGQLKAAGTAITLTAARTVFLAEYASTPGDNYQAACRAHRVGQTFGVQAYLAMVPGSLDGRVAAIAARKAREIAQIFD